MSTLTTVLILLLTTLVIIHLMRSGKKDSCDDAGIGASNDDIELVGGDDDTEDDAVIENVPDADDIHNRVKSIQHEFLQKSEQEKKLHLKTVFGTRIQPQLDRPPPRNSNFPRSLDPVLEKALGRGEFAPGCRTVKMVAMPQPQNDSYTLDDHRAFQESC